MQCGVASLAMICKHYGKVYSTKYIEQYCHPTNEGSSWKNGSVGIEKGIALCLQPDDNAYCTDKQNAEETRSLKFLTSYLKQYRKYFTQIALGLLLGCILQLVMPFLTQAIVDIGITHKDIGFIWLVLLGELMIVTGKTATNFIRRWLLLHISMRINISLVSDFFIKLLKLPMSFLAYSCSA